MFVCRAGADVRLPQPARSSLPAQRTGAKDCGIRVLQFRNQQTGLAFVDGHHVRLHRLADGVDDVVPCLGETTEEHDGFGTGEGDEVGEGLSQDGSGETENLQGKLVALLGSIVS